MTKANTREEVALKAAMLALDDAINMPSNSMADEDMAVRDYRHTIYPIFERLVSAILALLSERDTQAREVEGWRLVPVEPTQGMIDAGCAAWFAKDAKGMWPAYAAMLSAAPTPPLSQGEDEVNGARWKTLAEMAGQVADEVKVKLAAAQAEIERLKGAIRRARGLLLYPQNEHLDEQARLTTNTVLQIADTLLEVEDGIEKPGRQALSDDPRQEGGA